MDKMTDREHARRLVNSYKRWPQDPRPGSFAGPAPGGTKENIIAVVEQAIALGRQLEREASAGSRPLSGVELVIEAAKRARPEAWRE
jgi:hypothetical protein